MSKGGERTQGTPGSPIPYGYGMPATCVSRFAHPQEKLKLRRYVVSGVTKDSTGVILGGCTVEVFETVSKLPRGGCVSNADGQYSIDVNDPDVGLTFYVYAYKGGSPDVAGTTVNTLIGVEA